MSFAESSRCSSSRPRRRCSKLAVEQALARRIWSRALAATSSGSTSTKMASATLASWLAPENWTHAFASSAPTQASGCLSPTGASTLWCRTTPCATSRDALPFSRSGIECCDRGGRALYTDAMIVTGALSNEEMAARSSIGYYLFLPPGENERLIREAGLELLRADDVTEAAAVLSKRWRDARALRQSELVKVEGEANFDGLQTFLACVHNVAGERRLSRFLYLARKREGVWRRQ